MAAGAVWGRTVPVAGLMAGLSGKPVPEAAMMPPAMREQGGAADSSASSAAVLRDVRAAMFEEGLKQIARKSAARQAAPSPPGA